MCGLGWAKDIPIWAWIVGYGTEAILLYLAYRALKYFRRRQG
jgi:hypothetical protein